jgi:hypothetical protein
MWMALLVVWVSVMPSLSLWRDDESSIEKMVNEMKVIMKMDTLTFCECWSVSQKSCSR